jgi:hypothetical protein
MKSGWNQGRTTNIQRPTSNAQDRARESCLEVGSFYDCTEICDDLKSRLGYMNPPLAPPRRGTTVRSGSILSARSTLLPSWEGPGGGGFVESVRIRLSILTILLLALFFSATRSFAAGEVDAQFDGANKLYAQNKFVEAAAAYEQVLAGGTIAAGLYFNLGNAYFKAGQLGRAITAYRQAEGLTPRDPDLRANLRFAQNRVTGPTLKTTAWQRAVGTISLREWTWLATGAFWLTFGLLVARQLKPKLAPNLKWWTWSSAAAVLVLFLCVGVAWSHQQPGRVAIIVVSEATVRHSPFEEAASSFTASDGATLRVLDEKGDWLQVTDDANRFGWVKQSATSWSPRA